MEEPIVGLQAIADCLYMSVEVVKKHSKDWQKRGFLFCRLKGRPPHRRKVIISYPSLIEKIRGE